MPGYSLGHVQNHVLLQGFAALAKTDRGTTAQLLAHIGEIDARRLYADEGFTSMFDYCVRVHHFTEDMAGMRIRAARTARRFSVIFDVIADGRLTVTAVCLVSKHTKGLSRDAALELLTAAAHKTKDGIRRLLAERFPQADLPAHVRAVAPRTVATCVAAHVPERVEVRNSSSAAADDDAITDARSSPCAAADATPVLISVAAEARPGRTTPLSPGRFGLQLTMSAETYEKWRRVEDLLATSVPRGDYAQRLDRALDALIERLEKRRFGKTDRPRRARPSKDPNHIPAAVKREVHERDGGQCTFKNAHGTRCEKRDDLQYDHVIPKARGGTSTVPNLRLRCHAHNQLEAERMFGAGFMEERREAARASRRPAALGPPLT